MAHDENDHLTSSDVTVITSNHHGKFRGHPHPHPHVCNPLVSDTFARENFLSRSFIDTISTFWRAYRDFVRKHHIKLELADSAIHRLIFWLPHHENLGNATPWREVLYGLLSMNQLAMYYSQQQDIENTFGFSLRTCTEPTIPATSLRIFQTIIHCIMPSFLELFSQSNLPDVRTKYQAQLRLRLEQVKFGIRLYLLHNYWNQITTESKGATNPGIMLNGGQYQTMEEHPLGISQEELQSIQRWRQYRGRRTGLVISKHATTIPTTTTGTATKMTTTYPQISRQRVLWGEILYYVRSVWWAIAEARHAGESQQKTDSSISKNKLLHAWIISLVMDLLSLGLLSKESNNGNPFSKNEWNRRRMKLFLYILRAPIWNHVTSPTLERTSAVLQRVPLVGGLIESYLWDWILYWKHPFVSEEG